MSDTVLVTGGFGLVGSATVRQLAERRPPRRRRRSRDTCQPSRPRSGCRAASRFGGPTSPIPTKFSAWSPRSHPTAIIHLAAIIAPAIYRMPKVARQGQRRCHVDVGSRRRGRPDSAAVRPRVEQCGVRRPKSAPDHAPLTADDPMRPCDVYSGQKAEAEDIVRSSSLEWVVLRFGACAQHRFSAMPLEQRRHVLRRVHCRATAGCTTWTSATSRVHVPRRRPPTS